jgi:hypothetical protein
MVNIICKKGVHLSVLSIDIPLSTNLSISYSTYNWGLLVFSIPVMVRCIGQAKIFI